MSTLIITENQYEKLILSSVAIIPKTIRVTESQYSRLLLKEEALCKAGCSKNSGADMSWGWSTKNGTDVVDMGPDEFGDWDYWKNPYFAIGGDLIHVSYFCGNYIYGADQNVTDGFGLYNPKLGGENGLQVKKFPNEKMEKWVKSIWTYGVNKQNRKRLYLDTSKAITDGIEHYISLIESGKVKFKYRRTNEYGEVIGYEDYDPKHAVIKSRIRALRELSYAASLYPRGGTCPTIIQDRITKGLTDALSSFVSWMATWTLQDWLDAISVVLFVASIWFPPLALVAMGLEAFNAGIEIGRALDPNAKDGSWSMVGIRLLAIVGGPLIGRGVGMGLKYGYKFVTKTFGYAMQLMKVIGRKVGLLGKQATKEAIERTIQETTEAFIKKNGLNAADAKAMKAWMEKMMKNPEKFKSEIAKMEKLLKAAQNGDQAAIKALQKLVLEGEEKIVAHGAKKSLMKRGLNYYFKKKHPYTLPGGKNIKISQYFFDVLEVPGKIGGAALLSLYSASEYYRFHKWLEARKYNLDDEQILKSLDGIIPESTKEATQDKVKKYLKNGTEFSIEDGELAYIMIELEQVMPKKEFEKFVGIVQGQIDSAIIKFITDREELLKLVRDIRKISKGQLYSKYLDMCGPLEDYGGGTTLQTVEISSKRTEKQEQDLQKFINDKGEEWVMDGKNTKFIFKGKHNGIYQAVGDEKFPDEKTIWKSVTSNCKIATPLVKELCKGALSRGGTFQESPAQSIFCQGAKLNSITTEKLNDISIEYIKGGETQQSIKDFLFDDYFND